MIRDFGKLAAKNLKKNVKMVESIGILGYNCGVLPVVLEDELVK